MNGALVRDFANTSGTFANTDALDAKVIARSRPAEGQFRILKIVLDQAASTCENRPHRRRRVDVGTFFATAECGA
ncbi:MAG: hypothetical protein SGJ11_09135 [Phycisphaerae bacterium]|nr:hypothetical protein [Phycisphaerae bacterium]